MKWERIVPEPGSFERALPEPGTLERISLPEPVLTRSEFAEIRQLHTEIKDLLRSSLEKSIRIGELLSKAKASAGRGNWLKWFEKADFPFCVRTAQRYIGIFKNPDQIESYFDDPDQYDTNVVLPDNPADAKEAAAATADRSRNPETAATQINFRDPRDPPQVSTNGISFEIMTPEFRRKLIVELEAVVDAVKKRKQTSAEKYATSDLATDQRNNKLLGAAAS
jgi:hypothetical protein